VTGDPSAARASAMHTQDDIFPTVRVSRAALTVASKRLKRATTLRSLKRAEMVIRLSGGDLMMDIPSR
jgi:hypothetical protein